MKINQIIVGEYQTNCYLIEQDNKIIIVDPGADYPKIKSLIKDKKVIAIFITHYHHDHIGVLDELLKEYQVPINPQNISNFNYQIIQTPGHKPDCLTFYFPLEKIMFTGDFIFYEDIGAIHFPGGSYTEMVQSLELIQQYPDDIKLYPGHGPSTTLKYEKKFFPSYIIN